MLTESDIRAALHAQADAQTPADPWPGFERRLRSGRRRAAGAGVALTAAAVGLAVAVPAVRDHAGRPSTTSTIPVGPQVLHLPAALRAANGRPQWQQIAASSPNIFWAVGTLCPPSATTVTCPVILEESTDAGKSWSRRTPPPAPSKADLSPAYLPQIAASPTGIWIYGTSHSAIYHAGLDGRWQTLRSPAVDDGTAGSAAVVGNTLEIVQTQYVSYACHPRVHLLLVSADSIHQRVIDAATTGGNSATVQSDGSIWDSGERIPSTCATKETGPGPVFTEEAPAGQGFGPLRPLPGKQPVLFPVNASTAFARAEGPQTALERSTDGGRTWTTAPLDGPPSISLLAAYTPSQLVVLSENARQGERSEIYVSSDAGRTAQRVLILDTKFYALFPFVTPLAGNELGLLNGNTMLLSLDGGRTWHQQGSL